VQEEAGMGHSKNAFRTGRVINSPTGCEMWASDGADSLHR
jgi:hypothetical protein